MTSEKTIYGRMTLDLPWPPRVLHPNERAHWAPKAKATKKARADAAWMARAAGLGRLRADAIRARIIFSPPNNRGHDLDGLVANVKAYIDGIADVLGVNDRNWRIEPVKGPASPLGNVRFVVEPVDTWEQAGEAATRALAHVKRGAA